MEDRSAEHPFNVLLLQSRTNSTEYAHEQTAFRLALEGERVAWSFCNVTGLSLGERIQTKADALIIAGSPLSVFANTDGFSALRHLLDDARARGIPILGVCFGARFIARHFGGWVIVDGGHGEHGTVRIRKTPEAAGPLWDALPEEFTALQSHDDHIAELPRGATVTATNERCWAQAFALDRGRIVGTQFHPERTPEWYACILRRPHGLPEDKIARYREILKTIRPSPEAHSLLRRFIRHARDLRG